MIGPLCLQVSTAWREPARHKPLASLASGCPKFTLSLDLPVLLWAAEKQTAVTLSRAASKIRILLIFLLLLLITE